MLIKAILTGGVLSALAGSIVYFGTEGADALETNTSESVRVEETALAGAADVAVGTADTAGDKVADMAVEGVADIAGAEVDVQDPPAKTSEPKTKWLDQYLKKSKPKTKTDPKVEPALEPEAEPAEVEAVDEAVVDAPVVTEDKPNLRGMNRITSDSGSARATGTYVVSKTGRVETLDIKGDVDIEVLKEELGLDADKNIKTRGMRKMGGGKSMTVLNTRTQRTTDYAPILAEAKKLLVTDMRNQAFLEIIDHAVDNLDMTQAADIVEELSTPELRDTARARIGTGLARCGKTEAAFAVLDEIEIDELAAPIRLEIITALMATKQERRHSTPHR